MNENITRPWNYNSPDLNDTSKDWNKTLLTFDELRIKLVNQT